MDDKKYYIDYVKNSPLVKAGLDKVEDKAQREQIEAMMKEFAEKMADAFVPMIKALQADPELAENVKKKLQNNVPEVDIHEKEDNSGNKNG